MELWSTIASVGTFVVIAATAIAAVFQLRHMRAANKIARIQAFFTEYEGQELRDAFRFARTELTARLEDPVFRAELRGVGGLDRVKHPELAICNFFDQWGLYYRDGVIDEASFMRVNAGIINLFWTRLEPVIAIFAAASGDYPKGETRIELIDRWADEDRAVNV